MPKTKKQTQDDKQQRLAAVPADSSPARTATEIKLWTALADHPGATTADLARHAGIGTSTAGKILPGWQKAERVTRATGSLDGNRRLPGTWAIATEPTATTADTASQADVEATSGSRGVKRGPSTATASAPATSDGEGTLNRSGTPKLRSGELVGLVEDCLRDRADKELSPADVARLLERSGGAVRNCLDKLTRQGVVEQTNDKPRRFRLAASAIEG